MRESVGVDRKRTLLPLAMKLVTSSRPSARNEARSAAIGIRFALPALMPRSSAPYRSVRSKAVDSSVWALSAVRIA